MMGSGDRISRVVIVVSPPRGIAVSVSSCHCPSLPRRRRSDSMPPPRAIEIGIDTQAIATLFAISTDIDDCRCVRSMD